MDCFVTELIIEPAKGRTRRLLAMTEYYVEIGGSFRLIACGWP